MKQSINPAVAIAAVVIVAVIAGFFIFKAMAPPTDISANMSPAEYQRKMMEQSGKAADSMKQKPPMGGNSDYAEKMKSQYGGGGQKPASGN